MRVTIKTMNSRFRYIDAHAHLNDKRFDPDLPEVLARMRAAETAAIVVGTDKEMSERAVALAEEHADLWATIGQHPTDKHEEEFDAAWYREQAKNPHVVGIGECGLDYYWPSNPDSHKDFGDGTKEKRRQRDLFAAQIALAQEVQKPLMVHGRPTPKSMDAYEDILSLLDEAKYGGDRAGDIHFFVGTIDIARKFLDRGFTLSFTGVLTFTHDYDEMVRFLPLDRILAETDVPYVAPVPHRGKRNEPAFVIEVVKKIAVIRNEDEEKVRAALIANVDRVFGVA